MLTNIFSLLGLLFISTLIFTVVSTHDRLGPVVIWHGINECYQARDPQRIAQLFSDRGSKVKLIKIGDKCSDDQLRSIVMPTINQVQRLCEELTADSEFRNGFTGIGLSQGALLMRGLIEICPGITCRRFISVGGPQQGVYGVPDCSEMPNAAAKSGCQRLVQLQKVLSKISPRLGSPSLFTGLMNSIKMMYAPASYWNDPTKEPSKAADNFINFINNAIVLREDLRERVTNLEKFILVHFSQDRLIKPSISEAFGFYEPGSFEKIVLFNETRLYTEDLIGLKKLYQEGKMFFEVSDTNHMTFTDQWFVENIIEKHLK